MTLEEIFNTDPEEQQAAAKAAVLQWLGDHDVERLAVEKYRDAATTNAAKSRKS